MLMWVRRPLKAMTCPFTSRSDRLAFTLELGYEQRVTVDERPQVCIPFTKEAMIL